MIGKAIFDILSNDSGVTDLVPASNITPLVGKQGTSKPIIVYNLRTTPENIKDGVSLIKHVIVQIDVYSDNYDTTEDITNAVRSVLDHFSGTRAGFVLQTIILEDIDEIPDPDPEVYRMNMDFRARWHDVAEDFLLLQTGDFLLLQTGDKLILQ